MVSVFWFDNVFGPARPLESISNWSARRILVGLTGTWLRTTMGLSCFICMLLLNYKLKVRPLASVVWPTFLRTTTHVIHQVVLKLTWCFQGHLATRSVPNAPSASMTVQLCNIRTSQSRWIQCFFATLYISTQKETTDRNVVTYFHFLHGVAAV